MPWKITDRFLKRAIIGGSAGLVVLLILGIFFHLGTPALKASSIQKFGNEIPSNAPIKITFNQLMNRKSAQEHFSITPPISGRFSWFLNTITFYPEERFAVGQSYAITISKDATNVLGKPLAEDIVLSFFVIDPPKVLLAVPNEATAVDSKITVMFDRPMTEFTTYDVAESREFPLKITPELPGRFKWIGTAAFQYIPKDRLAYSTEYKAVIPKGTKSLDGGELEEEYAFTFETQRIALNPLMKDQRADQPYLLSFNQPVNLESVREHLTVEKKGGGEVALQLRYHTWKEVTYDENGKKIEKEIVQKNVVEVSPAQNDWGYDNRYTVEVKKGIAGLEGNLLSESETKEEFHINTFLLSYSPRIHKGDLEISPFTEITLHFDQEVDLGSVRNYLKIEPAVELKANYGKMCDPSWEPKESPDEECAKIDDLNVVVFAPKAKLQNLQSYTVTLDKNVRAKNGRAYLKENVQWNFTTADNFRILRSVPETNGKGSYKRLCFFTSTLADTKDIEKYITFSPVGKEKVRADAHRVNFSDPCHPQANEEYLLSISTLLNPEANYSVALKESLKDRYGQSLGQQISLNFITESLRDSDTSLTLMQPNFYAVSPLEPHAFPLFSSTNLENFDLEICHLSAAKFLELDSEIERKLSEDQRRSSLDYGWNAFAPSSASCSEYIKANKKLKKAYWEKQYTEIDVKTEVGGILKPGYYYIRASSPKVYHTEPIYAYDEAKKISVITGEQKIPIRPTQILAVTNLHVTVKNARDESLFWVTDLATGKPVSGAEVKLASSLGALLAGSSATNADGISRRALHGLPFQYAIVSNTHERSECGPAQAGLTRPDECRDTITRDETVTHAYWSEGISPWEFRVDYSPVERYLQGYLYTERPLYQPTHEVFFKGIIREDNDAVLKLPEQKSIEVTVYDSRGTNISKKSHSISAQGTFAGSLKLDKTAPLGRYSIETCMNRNQYGDCLGGIFFNTFYVEEYRKPEYKLEVKLPQDDYVNGDTLRGIIDAEYFFGAPVSSGKVNWSLQAQNYYFDEYKEEWFSFTDNETFRKCYWGCPFEDQYLASGEGDLDEKGEFLVTHKIDLFTKDQQGKVKPPDSSKIYTLSASVQDKNNQTVSGRKEVMVHRGEYYVGVKNEEYVVQVDKDMPIKVITVDHKGVPIFGKGVDLELSKLNWKYVKKKNVDGGFYFDNELEEKSVKKVRVNTDSDGFARYAFTPREGGEYLVRATGHDSKGNSFSSTVDFYATTHEVVHWRQENNNRMELKLDKISYDIGDTAKVLVKSPYTGVKALVTYERGKVMEAKVVDINSNTEILEVPITDAMVPNFFLSVLEVKGKNADEPPDFKMGYANIVVETKNKELKISVKPDKKRYQPRERVNLEITTTDRQGNPVAADLSIAAVDASLLALKGNPKRDLVNLFYNRRYLGVYTSDNMTNLLKRVNLSDLKGSKGGGGKGEDEFGKVRGKFEDTAFWRSSLATDSSGKLVTSFALPDNLTTWNLEVIGSTNNSLFGDTNETITTQKAVIVRPVLPHFALFGDDLRLAALVHNFTDDTASFSVNLDTKNLTVTDKRTKTVSIPAGGQAKVMWQITVPKLPHGTLASVTISASGGNAEDAILQEFPIQSYSTPETVALSSFTEDVSFTEKVLLPETVDPEFGELKITTGATVATYLSDSLDYLIGFPYGCTEQTISRIVPNVVVKNATSLPNLKDKIKLAPIYDENGKVIDFDTVVETSLQRLYDYQRSDGGWGYFPDSRESYPYVTAYIVFGLDQIQKAGYHVDSGVVSKATAFLQDYMKSNRDRKDSQTGKLREKDSYWANNRAYMLFVMSEIGQGDLGLTNSLYDDRELLSNAGKLYLVMSLHALNPDSTSRIEKIFQDLENQARIETRGTYIRNDTGSSFDMMTHTKVTALMIQALNRIEPDHPLLPKLIKWLIRLRQDGRWSTTQENVTALIALTEYLERSGETEGQYHAKVTLNKKSILEYDVKGENVLDQHEVSRAISELKLGGDGNPVIFTKDGSGKLYYDMVLRYFLPIEDIKPRSEGFNVERHYYRLDDEKLEHPVTQAKAGETLRGRLTIVVPEERSLVAVENFLPAGFELVNFEFETADRTLGSRKVKPKSPSNLEGTPYSAQAEVNAGYDECYDCGYGFSGYYYGYSNWNHKEIRSDRLFLFSDYLPRGVYEYDYFVQVTSEGKFHHPPALVSEMYFPENFGRTRGEWIEVKE